MIFMKIALTIGAIYVILCTIGCSNGYEHGWSWGITIEDGDRETDTFRWTNHNVKVEDITIADVVYIPPPHKDCKVKHYIDPYTKLEYCLPPDFRNINQLHLYRVQK